LQLTDKVLLPATISYTDGGEQQSVSQCYADAAEPSDLCVSELTAEPDHSDVVNAADDDSGDSSKVDEMGVMYSAAEVISSSAVPPVTETGCTEADKPLSTSDQAGLHPADNTVMSASVVNIPSEASDCDVIHLSQASLLPSTVNRLLQSSLTDSVVTDSLAVVASGGQLASCSDEDQMNSAVSNIDDCSAIQHTAEWTRYFTTSSSFCCI